MNLREQIRASGPRQWPGKDLLLDINAKYIIILCTVVVAIFSVLIIIFAHKNYTFWKITRVIAINSFYILFGSLCAILELVLSYYRLIKPVEIQLMITSDMMMNFRIPILFYAGYKLYDESFFSQFPYICTYGIIGKAVNIVLSSIITKYLLLYILDIDITFSQMTTFGCVANIVESLNVFSFLKKTSNNNFYLLYGSYIIGNATAVDVFNASVKIAHLHKTVHVSAQTYFLLGLKPIVDAVSGLIIGSLVALLSAVIVRVSYRPAGCKDTDLSDVILIISSTCFVYFFTSLVRISSLFGVFACCLVQKRYLFCNLSEWSANFFKNTMEPLSFCMEQLFLIFIGYKLLSVDLESVYKFCLIALGASYGAKMLMILIVSMVINLWKKSPVKTQMQGLLVFGGVRGARAYPLIVAYIGPFSRTFQDMIIIMIVFSVLVDNIITNLLVRMLKGGLRNPEVEDKEIHMVPQRLEKMNNDCFVWMRKKEMNLYQLFKIAD